MGFKSSKVLHQDGSMGALEKIKMLTAGAVMCDSQHAFHAGVDRLVVV
jgi:hypothetical protein